jgi:hypothetical protein
MMKSKSNHEVVRTLEALWLISTFIGCVGILIFGITSVQDTVSFFMTKSSWFAIIASFFVMSVLIVNYLHLMSNHKKTIWLIYGWTCNSVAMFSWLGLLIFRIDADSNCTCFGCHYFFTSLFSIFSILFLFHLNEYNFLVGSWITSCVIGILGWVVLLYCMEKLSYIGEYVLLFIYLIFWLIYMLKNSLNNETL